MSTTMNAAIHLGEKYNQNSIAYKNINFDAIRTLFVITQKFQNHEIQNVSTIEWHCASWIRSTLLNDKV